VSTLVVIQSNYIPWRGYFDMLSQADHVILYDDVQYTKNDWRNRNRIITRTGTAWLTIPIATSGSFGMAIKDAQVADLRWAKRHWKTLCANYAGAPHFSEYKLPLQMVYSEFSHGNLSMINRRFIEIICNVLDINVPITSSMEHDLIGDRVDRLVNLCKQVGANTYLSGKAAAAYIDQSKFEEAGIELQWMEYDYPKYPQCFGSYDPYVSVLDLLFNTGPDAPRYIWG